MIHPFLFLDFPIGNRNQGAIMANMTRRQIDRILIEAQTEKHPLPISESDLDFLQWDPYDLDEDEEVICADDNVEFDYFDD
jgi:hypothetical protein